MKKMQKALLWAKKHKKLLAALALLVALALVLSAAQRRRTRVSIRAVLDEKTMELSVEQTVEYVNRGPLPLDCLYLHLYPNAYLDEARAPVLPADFARAYPAGFSAGETVLSQVLVGEKPAAWALEGERQTFLKVALETPLKPGLCQKLSLSYRVRLPESSLRLGYSDHDVRLLGAFAQAAYHDGARWHLDEYGPVGDPFVQDTAQYLVALRLPAAYVAAGPGARGGEDGLWRFEATARDLAVVLSRDFCVSQAQAANVTVRGFAFAQEDAEELAELGARAVEVFTGLFGPMARRELLLCAGDFFVGGMETPGLVLLDEGLLSDELLEYVVAHETAHQWWYADVGSDQVQSPWQDEALTEYSTLLYFEATQGRNAMQHMYASLLRPALERADAQGVRLDAPLSAFHSSALYDAVVYKKGAAMFHDVRALLGNEAFFRALKKYHREYTGRVAPPEALLQALGPAGSERALLWIRGELP